MKLLYCSTFMFRTEGEVTYALPSCADPFFQKYLEVFDFVRVIGVPVRKYLDTSALVRMTDSRISVRIADANTSPRDFKNDAKVEKVLREEISKAEAILIKPASRRGIKAIAIAKEMHKPYMIEMTGDIHNALRQHPNIFKRLYAPFFYRQIKKAIEDCEFGLYVSKDYLQEQFPIKGEMCGCSDVILGPADDNILSRRLAKIDSMNIHKHVDISLIGFYQGKMKGVDCAIRALSQLPETYHLNILGNGTEENRKKWIAYGLSLGVKDRIHFPNPLPNATAVLQWIDKQDFFVLPTRSEGLCRCAVESISRGCVCFTTDVCSMPELIEKGCMHSIGDDKTLASLLTEYSENKDLMKKNAKRNFEKSKEYTFEVLKEKRNQFLRNFRNYCATYNA